MGGAEVGVSGERGIGYMARYGAAVERLAMISSSQGKPERKKKDSDCKEGYIEENRI
jgi:hypothetical protein